MIEFALQVLNIVWKLIVIYAIISLGMALARSGKGTIRDIFDTVVMWINMIVQNTQRKLVSKMRAQQDLAQKEKEA